MNDLNNRNHNVNKELQHLYILLKNRQSLCPREILSRRRYDPNKDGYINRLFYPLVQSYFEALVYQPVVVCGTFILKNYLMKKKNYL